MSAFAFLRAAFAHGETNERQRRTIARASNFEAIAALASRHVLTPALHVALSKKGMAPALPSDFVEFLAATYALNARRNQDLMQETARIAALLRDGGLDPPVLLKGTAYVHLGVVPQPGARFIGDIDMLLPPRQAELAVRLLVDSGMTCVRAEQSPMDLDGHHHFPRLSRPESPFAVEIHRGLPERYAILRGEDVLRGSTESSIQGVAVRLPRPEPLALHHILHAQEDAPLRARPPLRYLHDMALIAARFGGQIDWEEISTRFRDGGMLPVLQTWMDATEWFCGVRLLTDDRRTVLRRLRSRRAIVLCQSMPLRIADPAYLASFLCEYLQNAARLAVSRHGRRELLKKICSRKFYARIIHRYKNHWG